MRTHTARTQREYRLRRQVGNRLCASPTTARAKNTNTADSLRKNVYVQPIVIKRIRIKRFFFPPFWSEATNKKKSKKKIYFAKRGIIMRKERT